MVIDIHAHYYPPEYLEKIGRADLPPRQAAALASQSMGERLALLDTRGIDTQILSISQAQPYLPRESEAAGAASLLNDVYLELCHTHPSRFYTFVALPLPHIDAALRELERTWSSSKTVGVTLGCSVGGLALDDPVFEPIFQELNRIHAVVFLHPVGRDDIPWLAGDNLEWMVGAPFEDTVTALRLVMAGVTRRHPQITFIVPHLGGTLPFLAARILRKNDAQGLSAGLQSLYFDTVSGSPSSLAQAAETFGANHLLFGTDYPYCSAEEFAHHLSYLQDNTWESGVLDAIRGKQAAALLNLTPGL